MSSSFFRHQERETPLLCGLQSMLKAIVSKKVPDRFTQSIRPCKGLVFLASCVHGESKSVLH